MKMNRSTLLILWLLIAWPSLPSPAKAETSRTAKTVSVRELSVPPKALEEFNHGATLLKAGDAARSLPFFRRAIARFPGFFEAYYEMGMANIKLLRIAPAEENFRTSIELSGNRYALAFFALGAILDDQGKFREAETVLRAGLRLDPKAWPGNYYLSLALFGLYRLQEAEKSVREILLQNPQDAHALRLMVNIQIRARNYAAALQALDEYLVVDPSGEIATKAKVIRKQIQRELYETADTMSPEE